MNTKSTKKEKVIFAFNYKAATKFDLQKVADFAEDYDGEIHLPFETETVELPGTQTEIFNRLFEEGIPDFSFEMVFSPKDQFLKEVMDYSREIDADMIIGVNRKVGLPELLISGRLSRRVVKDLRLEIPVFHSGVAEGFPQFEFNYN